MNAVDVVVVLLALAFAISGYAQGLLVGLLSFVGFVGGALAGLLLGPRLLGFLEPGLGASILALLLVLLAASIGQGFAAFVGGRLRRRLAIRQAQRADVVGGALLGAGALLVAAWAIGLAVSASQIPVIATVMRNSEILRQVDLALPAAAGELTDEFGWLVDAGTFPDVVAPFVPEHIREVGPPDPRVVRDPQVRAAASSVVKVVGEAQACGRVIEGSGFVVAAERVMTNAHVLAGVASPTVLVPGGGQLDATVVHFDAQTDVAVLAVPGLERPALTFRTAPAGGDPAVVLGYPRNGPLSADAARIRSHQVLLGEDIYGEARVNRQVIALRGEVQPGNSGGPLVAGDGEVYGMIFAASLTDTDTAYALPPDEVSAAMDAASTAPEGTAVSTGACV